MNVNITCVIGRPTIASLDPCEIFPQTKSLQLSADDAKLTSFKMPSMNMQCIWVHFKHRGEMEPWWLGALFISLKLSNVCVAIYSAISLTNLLGLKIPSEAVEGAIYNSWLFIFNTYPVYRNDFYLMVFYAIGLYWTKYYYVLPPVAIQILWTICVKLNSSDVLKEQVPKYLHDMHQICVESLITVIRGVRQAVRAPL